MVVLAALLALPALGHTITFHLAPQAGWNDGKPAPENWLLDGEVRLYRLGTYEPEFVAPINHPVELPAGDWTWIAESQGYVTVATGLVRLPTSGNAIDKVLIWPVVPACELELSQSDWSGVVRLDVVSLDFAATYPTSPATSPRLQVPAGKFLAYTVDARGISAISRVERCAPFALRPLRRPQPPEANLQDFLAAARLPPEFQSEPRDLQALFRGGTPGEAPIQPTATIRSDDWQTFFFLDVPADQRRFLSLKHPMLVSRQIDFPPLGGSVREIQEDRLVPKPTLEIPIDYRPAREHRLAEVSLRLCPPEPAPFDVDSCDQLPTKHRLEPGVMVYTFPSVDVGRAIVEASVDGERIIGVGDGSIIPVTESDGPILRAPEQLLKEFHVWGHLLVDDDPVPGEVRLESVEESRYPLRRFPTDEDLEYHLYYFGKQPPEFLLQGYPEDLRDLPKNELHGLPLGTVLLRACDDEDFCRVFHVWTIITGDTRFDIDLSGGRGIIRVVDAETQEAVADAQVLLRSESQTPAQIHVFEDRVATAGAKGGEALVVRTNGEGEVKLRASGEGLHRLAVRADGYRPYSGEISLPREGLLRLDVELEKVQRTGAPVLRLANGKPARGAFLLAVGSEGEVVYPCSRPADDMGQLTLSGDCLALEDTRFFLMHPEAALKEITSASLEQASDLILPSRSAQPLSVRLINSQGQPLPGETVSLRFGNLVLSADHFLAAASAGISLPFKTDSDGRLNLQFLDPNHPFPELVLPSRAEAFSLAGTGGEVLELVITSAD